MSRNEEVLLVRNSIRTNKSDAKLKGLVQHVIHNVISILNYYNMKKHLSLVLHTCYFRCWQFPASKLNPGYYCCFKIISTVIFILSIQSTLKAQLNVRALGNDDFNWPSEGLTAYNSIAKDAADNIYVAFQDSSYDNKISVHKYDGKSWKIVGQQGFSAGEAQTTSIAVNSAGIPYVAYKDVSASNKIVVKRFNGSSWVTVGSAGFSAGEVSFTSIAIDGEDGIYVVYRDWNVESKATVKKLSRGIWQTVGTAGFSEGPVRYPTLAFNSSNIPYVAYRDGGNDSKITVMRFWEDSWQNVGSAGFSDGLVDFPALAIGANDIPYVAYQDDAHEDKISVKKFNRGVWVSVGEEGFSVGTADYIDIAIGSDDAPYVVYSDLLNFQSLQIKKFVGDDWESIGYISDVYTRKATYATIVLNSEDVPFVGFSYKKANVMKYENQRWKLVGGDGIQGLQGGNISNIVLDDAGNPYIGWEDVSSDVKLTVSKFNGSNWQYEGNNKFSGGAVSWPAMAINQSGQLYIAYSDFSEDGKLAVKKIVNGTWQTLGSATISAGAANFIDYKIDPTGISYVAYMDGAYGDRITVKKFAHGVWQNVGLPGTAGGNAATARFSLALNSEGVPYLAYSNSINEYRATVRKFNGNSWELLPGADGISDQGTNHIKLAIGKNDILYVGFLDESVGYKPTVMKYQEIYSSWTILGEKGFTERYAGFMDLAVDPAGDVILLHDTAEGYLGYRGKINVTKYKSGLGWRDMGNAPFSAGRTWWPKLTLDKTGTPFVTYMNWENSYAYIKTLDVQLPSSYKELTVAFAAPNTGIFMDEGELICLATPTGQDNNFGPLAAKVWIESNQPTQFVQRHYQLMTINSSQTEAAQARITLYFTNDEFKAFNMQPNTPALLLPDADDPATMAQRKTNLLIEKRAGVSSDNSGLPDTYSGAITTLDPADNDIIWNSTFKRWEISFEVKGFSGFFIKTIQSTLPVQWVKVNAILNPRQQPLITWQVQEHNNNYFTVEYSSDGNYFATAGMVSSKGDGMNSYSFIHENNIAAKTYYRIRQTDKDGKYTYSAIVFIQTANQGRRLTVYPNPATETIHVAVSENYLNTKAVLINSGGIILQQIQINTEIVIVDMRRFSQGIYFLKMQDGNVVRIIKK